MATQIANGCVIDALTDLLGEDGWDVDGVIGIINENHGHGVPFNRISEIGKYAPVVVHTDNDENFHINGSGGIINVGSAEGEYTMNGYDRVVVVAHQTQGTDYHALCLRANDLVVFSHINVFIHRKG